MRCCEEADSEPTDVFEGVERAKRSAKVMREAALAKALADANAKARLDEQRAQQREAQLRALANAKEEIISGGKLFKVNKNLSIIYDEYGRIALCSIEGDKAIDEMGLSDYYPSGFAWESDTPSESQMKRIQSFGVPAAYIANKGHCSFIMQALFDREKEGLCSYRQIKMLGRYHISNLKFCTKKKVVKSMDILTKNHWKPNGEFYALFNGRDFATASTVEADNIEIC